MSALEPMEGVHRVLIKEGRGISNIPNPPLDQSWSEVDKLRWRAALCEYTTGITCRITDGHSVSGPGYDYRFPELVGVRFGSSSQSVFAKDAWYAINHLEDGAMEARRQLGLEEYNPPREVSCGDVCETPDAAPGDLFVCPECGRNWRAVEAGPLDIDWERDF